MFISRSSAFPHLARIGKDAAAKAPRQQYPGLQQSPDAAPDQSSARCQRSLKCAKTHIYEDNVLEYSEVSRTIHTISQLSQTIHTCTISVPQLSRLHQTHRRPQCPDMSGGTPAMACARLMEDACLDKHIRGKIAFASSKIPGDMGLSENKVCSQ